VLLAQSLVEHGSLDSLASNMQRSTDTVGSYLSNISPTAWIIAGIVVVVLLLVWSRR
jgi:hypothetical protein